MILVDTSGVLAAVDPRQAHHHDSAEVLAQPQRRILSPFVLAELDYLLVSRTGPAEAVKLLEDVARGVYQLEPFTPADIAACLAIIRRYADLRIGLADASVVVLADRHRCIDVLTLDQRHFRTIRTASSRPFRLLPFDRT